MTQTFSTCEKSNLMSSKFIGYVRQSSGITEYALPDIQVPWITAGEVYICSTIWVN